MHEYAPIDENAEAMRLVFEQTCDNVLEEYLRFKNRRYDASIMEEARAQTVEEWYCNSYETPHAEYRQMLDTSVKMEAALALNYNREAALALIARQRYETALEAAIIMERIRRAEGSTAV